MKEILIGNRRLTQSVFFENGFARVIASINSVRKNQSVSKVEEFRRQHDYPCWCGQTEARLVCRQLFGRRPFVVLNCAACGTHRILPRALSDQSAAESLYNEYQVEFSGAELEKIRNNILRRCRQVDMPFDRQKRVLDVGCGSGYVLNAVCDQFDCEGRGIDVDKRRIALARSRARRAEFECGLFDPAQLGRPYDVILFNAVLEHVVDPVRFLQQLNAALTPGGSLFVLTPNARSLSYRVLGSWWRELLSIGEHIYLFSPESLAACAQQAGLKVVSFSSDDDLGTPRLELGSLRRVAISLWWCYRESVKRVARWIGHPASGDILYAHLKKI